MQTRETDPLKIIHFDNVYQIASFLSTSEKQVALQVCKSWANFFSNNLLWKNPIAVEFGISLDLLKEIPCDVIKNNVFKQIYFRLNRLKKIDLRFPTLEVNVYRDKNKHKLLLACCSDDVEYFNEKFLQSGDDIYEWFLITTAANCKEIPLFLLEKIVLGKKLVKYMILIAVRFDNFDYVNRLLELHPETIDYICETICFSAIHNNINPKIVKRLLEKEFSFDASLRVELAKVAKKTKSLEIKYLINTYLQKQNETISLKF